MNQKNNKSDMKTTMKLLKFVYNKNGWSYMLQRYVLNRQRNKTYSSTTKTALNCDKQI